MHIDIQFYDRAFLMTREFLTFTKLSLLKNRKFQNCEIRNNNKL